jgi:hypothetical protein
MVIYGITSMQPDFVVIFFDNEAATIGILVGNTI